MKHFYLGASVLRLVFIFMGSVLPMCGPAGTVTNLLNPPLVLNPFRDDEYTLDLDMDQNGVVDFRLYSSGGGGGGVTMYLDWPSRLVVRTNGVVGTTNIDYSGLAALPFGTVVEATLWPSLGNRNWWPGFTNKNDQTQQYGNHEIGVGSGSYGTLGELSGNEAVVAVEFRIGGQTHYGYIHFDFRVARGYGGLGGYIYGWAYESTPNLPITAERLRSGPPALDFKINFFEPWPTVDGAASIGWNAIVGETNRVQASADLVTWADVSTNIVVTQDFMAFVVPPAATSLRFFRIVRGNWP